MEEGSTDAATRLRELQEELSELNILVKSRGYLRLIGHADEQIETRRNAFELNPLEKMDDVLKQEFLKGEIAGIRLFREFAASLVEAIAAETQELIQEIEHASKKDDSDGT